LSEQTPRHRQHPAHDPPDPVGGSDRAARSSPTQSPRQRGGTRNHCRSSRHQILGFRCVAGWRAAASRSVLTNLSEKGSDPLRRGSKTNQIDSPSQGSDPSSDRHLQWTEWSETPPQPRSPTAAPGSRNLPPSGVDDPPRFTRNFRGYFDATRGGRQIHHFSELQSVICRADPTLNPNTARSQGERLMPEAREAV
jgi:hypothetical protein